MASKLDPDDLGKYKMSRRPADNFAKPLAFSGLPHILSEIPAPVVTFP
jgi:hypothetical protein